MNHLLRSHAPISDLGWGQIDEEARTRLTPQLAGRKLVDFLGPFGWDYSATNLGRVSPTGSTPVDGAVGLQRAVLPLVEIRADFAVARTQLRDIDRGTDTADFESLGNAAQAIALAENRAVFTGWEGAITGIAQAAARSKRPLGTTADDYPALVAAAVGELKRVGIGGPYAMALGPDQYELIDQTAEHGGVLLFTHLEKILGGDIVYTPGIVGGLVLSQRGGDFTFECGQDISVGYDSHDSEDVRLYLQESFSFHVATPEAAVALVSD